MFKLQRLEITGFKSFADYTEIVFTGNGITAVVGPNGCGKSNVSDAIAWVLGEQRAKSLRGGEMKDVVFQGSRNRKPSGMAEVVLHLVRDEDAFDIEEDELEDIDQTLSEIDDHSVILDELEPQAEETVEVVTETVEVVVQEFVNGNEENGFRVEEVEYEKVQAAQVGSALTIEKHIRTKRHWRPRSFALDFAPGEAVSVTRRLYLSGESEYQLNGKTCRLRDIQDLFAGTGLSGAHYAIIEQGRIGQILSAKPADRRNLIEEAAGISKFRTRQRAAESRLETSKSNLSRISDIVSEIDKQANSLRRQASKTRRYVVLQDEFRVLLRQLFAAEGRRLNYLVKDLEWQLVEAHEAEKRFTELVAEKEEAVRRATQDARRAEEELGELRGIHSQNALERDRAEREHRYQSEQIVNLNQRSSALRSDISVTEERLSLARSEKVRLAKDEEKEGAEADASRAILIEAEQVYAGQVDNVRRIEEELEVCRGELMRHTAAVERFDEVARQARSNLQRMNERAGGLAREVSRAGQTLQESNAALGATQEELKNESAKLESLNAERLGLINSTSEARETLRQSEEALRNLENEFSRSRHRLETLQELEEKRAVYTVPVQKLFAAQDEIGVTFRGVLADYLQVDERLETAVESLFGAAIEAVIVSSLDDARKTAAWIKNTGAGRASILVVPDDAGPTNGLRPSSTSGAIAGSLGLSDSFLETLRRVFPRQLDARVVETFDRIDPETDGDVIDLEGDILYGGSLLVTGRETADNSYSSLLAFKRELFVLSDSVTKYKSEISAAKDSVDRDRTALATTEERTVDLQSLIIKVERHILGLEMQERSLRQEVDRTERHIRVVADETAEVARDIEETRAKIDEANANQEAAEAARAAAESNAEGITQELNLARSVSESENAILNEKRTVAATSGERRRSAQSALRRIETEERELDSRLHTLNVELGDVETKIGELRTSVSDIAGRISGAEDAIGRETSEFQELAEKVTAARDAADRLTDELAEVNHRAAEAMNERAAVEVRQAETLTSLRNISEKCVEELNCELVALTETEQLPEEFSLDVTRERVADLRQRLENFGAINMLAVEELAEAEERLLFLSSQRQDIIDSINSAEEALREIKERSRAKFKEAFEAVNANFMQYFQELFGGGRGEMTLLESDDILEAGIEVVAQPPGKRLQNILLLSGGEKAMTAIALVLAIFRYRPSPFCLLDEVDAPLDDANVGRFVSKIADMSEKTQFIVITHNKRTMEAARALYGVTMQEPGISKIVSVKFD